MPPGLMLLGPSRWRSEGASSLARLASPLALRRGLRDLMRGLGVHAVVMEDHAPKAGEDNFALFRRVIEDAQVSAFVLFWPLGARLHGLDVEIGHILTRLEEGALAPGDVYLLAERRNLGVDAATGVVAWSEPGNRTRYHEDLVARGCRVRRWRHRPSLWRQAGAIALEHRERVG